VPVKGHLHTTPLHFFQRSPHRPCPSLPKRRRSEGLLVIIIKPLDQERLYNYLRERSCKDPG
jgi:hypothetical protein